MAEFLATNYLGDLRELLYEWDDEIPDRIVHGNDVPGGPKVKARKGWFEALFNYMGVLKTLDALDEYSHSLYRGFVSHVYSTGFHVRDTRAEDIEMGNAVLASAIESVEGRAEVLAQAEDFLQEDPEDDAVPASVEA